MILLLFNTIFLILFYLNSKRLSLALGLYKKTNKTPIVGGLGIYLFFLIQLSYLLLFGEKLDLHDILIIVVISLIFFIGIIDDIINLDYKIRLSSIFIILIIFLNLENSFLIKYLYFETLNLTFFIGNASYIITPLFIILFLNSMNMADGINGNSGTIFLTYFIIFYIMGNENIESLLLILIPIIIFLIFNMNNKLYLGDSGIYLLSTMISFYIIKEYNFDSKEFSCEKIFLVLMVPGIDMFRLFCVRIFNKKNPFKGDLNHLHHLLVNKFNISKSLIITILIIIWPNIFYKIFIIDIKILIITNLLIYVLLLTYLTKLKNFSNYLKNNK
jgi:UDP-GlcNAc:undecaprenyl-phosphate/decaprenyl-phosphate GlcNAc-1-phosphate transferase